MSDPSAVMIMASTGTLAIGLSASVALKGWHEWLEVKRMEIGRDGDRASPARHEITDLRHRVRRLEAIANGSEG